MISKFASLIMRFLFFRLAPPKFTPDEIENFEAIYSKAACNHNDIVYLNPYPKYRFIQYISLFKPVIMHGSNNKDIVQFEPRRQTMFSGKYVDAVFATKDAIWSLFYAVFDRHKLVDNFRNACLHARKNEDKYYFFSLTETTLKKEPWTSGMVYFLPQQYFERIDNSIVSFDEWISKTPVKPIMRIEVQPQDFYLLNRVSFHRPTESLIKSWLLYKIRVKLKNRKS